MSRIRTRFAPSPTGSLHIGGARTALFSYLWAKHNQGEFLLRFEDTDKLREVPGSMEEIMEGLRWLGIEWDEGPDLGGEYGPYIQSQRLEMYTKYAQQLVDAGKAYYCFCTSEVLSEMREQQRENKLPPRYDRRCRRLDPLLSTKNVQDGKPYVIRMAVPEEQGTIVVQDAIRGELSFSTKDVDDQVILKSDGFPTYHLASVVDDHEMEISHVIRAEEWLPSTPKHVLLYQFLGWTAPVFAHLTVFLSKSGGKMSKRDGETALLAFRELGYLPEAIVNFSALLGWNPKTEEEFFSLAELVERFELSQINKGNPVFETDKMLWMNQHYIRKLSAEDLIARLGQMRNAETTENVTRFVAWWTEELDMTRRESVWKSLRDRSKTLLEVLEVMTLVDDFGAGEYDGERLVWKKSTPEQTKETLVWMLEQIEQRSETELLVEPFQGTIISAIAEKGWGNGDVLWPTRYALSGLERSPSPFELIELLGKNEVTRRMHIALKKLDTL